MLSYVRLPQGYSLMVNQLEGLPRVEQLVQSVCGDKGAALRALFPEEAAGGALLGLNEAGAAFALLSLSGDAKLKRLVPAALGSATAGGGLERAAGLGLEGLPPFVLAGVEAGHAPLSLAWDGRILERRLHAEGAFQLALGAEANAARGAFQAFADGLAGLDEAQVLAQQEALHLSQAWGRHSQVLLLERRLLLRYIDAEAHAQGLEPQAAWLARLQS